ncbi:MAG: alpha/beta hydrolase [Chloroflexi bacterium]|nr:alpha/beta hydrolase [Chloroflexota bacterium]
MSTAPVPYAGANSSLAGSPAASTPSGERLQVAERSVHVRSWGAAVPGRPSIWLENGIFGQLLGWGELPQQLEQDGWHVCAYDRGNYGWSSGAGPDRSAAVAAGEFAELLAALGETEPVLIVAWSGGGLVARCFAADWPERVAGLMLLDPVPPHYEAAVEAAFPQRYPAERAAQVAEIRNIAACAAAGQLREADIQEYIEPQTDRRYGTPYRQLLRESAPHWYTYAAELEAIPRSSDQVQQRPLPIHLPLQVLVADQPPLMSIEDLYERALAEQWRARQTECDAAATALQVRTVAAGHAIHRDAPTAVLAAVRDMHPRDTRPAIMV